MDLHFYITHAAICHIGAILTEGIPIGRLFHYSKKKRLMEMERNEKFKIHLGKYLLMD